MLDQYLNKLPLVAILRGISPEEILSVANLLIEEGIRIIEIPLNSPEPYRSIEILVNHCQRDVLIGAGTVLSETEVERVKQAGGTLVVSPNTNTNVINKTKEQNMVSIPGACTPTEIYVAIEAGCDAVKLFPAEVISPTAAKAIRAIMPPQLLLLAVGGINVNNMSEYMDMGINGFGIGSTFYKKGKSLSDIKHDTREVIATYQKIK